MSLSDKVCFVMSDDDQKVLPQEPPGEEVVAKEAAAASAGAVVENHETESSYNNNDERPEEDSQKAEQNEEDKVMIDINNDDQQTKVPINNTTKVPNNVENLVSKFNETSNNDDNESTNNVRESEISKKHSDNNEDDVEQFDGKIVYNPDGSAYIIEDGEDNDSTLLPRLPKQEGRIVVDRTEDEAETNPFPQIANAVYVTKSAAYYNALYGRACAKVLREKLQVSPDAPIVHTYKVYSLRSNTVEPPPPPTLSSDLPTAVPIKPILMCFICKLSFGYAKSFETHCAAEHTVDLNEEEKSILAAKNSSAIIQLVGKEKKAIVSFLEPVDKNKQEQLQQPDPPAQAASLPPAEIGGATEKAPAPALQQDEEDDTSKATTPSGSLSPSALKGLLSAALSQNPAMASFAAFAAAAAAASSSSSSPTTSSTMSSGLLPSPSFPLPPPPTSHELSNLPPPPSSLVDSFPLPLGLRGPPPPPPPGLPRNACESPINSASPIPSNANMLQGTTIGACPEHVNGRQAGVDCSKCDLILNRMPGSMGWNAARNSCKTLKCPKCNWHYKYQETLEIHMKEKHPENETTCIYCITGQQHPRLARGETYTCGYKPYRCEVCNYSTTTKGNLSIHMQSDKHLNNMQELQNGGALVGSPDGSRIAHSPGGRGMPPNPLAALAAKQKPSWRCDVCNYETNVARNLRIHMTSEKHTHNIMVLQQNVKHMQQLAASQQQQQPGGGPMFPLMPSMDPQQMLQMQLEKQPGQQPEAAMADIAYLQAVMMQMMTGGQFPGGPLPAGLDGMPNLPQLPAELLQGGGGGDQPMEPPQEPADPNPQFLYSCCVCRDFGTDSLEQLSQHLTQDRTKLREHEVSIVIAGNFICKLCSYKTNLKANFQLHCKTDKHLQRLNHVNHIKEGGVANEWKLKFLNVTNPVQLRCNACDYFTNSLHKMQLHAANQRHEISTILFTHLKQSEASIPEDKGRAYCCSLCKFSSPGKLLLMTHVRSMKHLQMEQIHQLQKRSEGNTEQTEIGDIFQVVEKNEPESSGGTPATPPTATATTTSTTEEGAGDASMDTTDSATANNTDSNNDQDSSPSKACPPCPLCQEPFAEYSALERHVLQVHSVNSEGLQRLLSLMEGSHWLNSAKATEAATHPITPEPPSTAGTPPREVPGGAVSEKHVYKYRCSQCSLAFKTAEKLSLHSQYHLIRDSTKCRLCSRSFRSVQALLKHVETGHEDVSKEELAHYKLGLMNHPLLLAGLAGHNVLDQANANELLKLNNGNDSGEANEEDQQDNNSNKEDKNEPTNLPLFNSSPQKTESKLDKLFSRKSEKGLNYPLEKYLDPNRPYKCEVCKESFTQKNILLVHYNSVSHLHKLKKTMQEQQAKEALQQQQQQQPENKQGSSLEMAISNLRKSDEDDSNKPYKCNICKVAYSQGSTLDIHIRSVLHQSRASKLQELAMSGQIDLSRPLIEQPDPKLLQDQQHRKLLTELLSPKSLNSSSGSSSSHLDSSPPAPSLPSPGGLTPQSSPLQHALSMLQQNSGGTGNGLGPKSLNDMFSQPDQFQQQQQQQLAKILQQIQQNSGNPGTSESSTASPSSSPFAQLSEMASKKPNSHVLKNLLQNYGFELVMQFNEYHQRQRRQKEEEEQQRREQKQKEAAAAAPSTTTVTTTPTTPAAEGSNNELSTKELNGQKEESGEKKENNLPEVKKSKCPVCSKEFSSIWVLKAHSEEIHKDVVPPEFIEKYIEELKSNLDKDNSNSEEGENANSDKESTPTKTPPVSNSEVERPPSVSNYPHTSTPKSGKSTPVDRPSRPSSSQVKEQPSLSDMQSAFHQAVLAAQQQSQKLNPMMMHISQLQNLNPLVAMNLQPPLIPPALLQAANKANANSNSNNANNGPNENMMQTLLAHIQSAQGQIDPQMQLLSKLGIDPKTLAQSGMDPKQLMQFGQVLKPPGTATEPSSSVAPDLSPPIHQLGMFPQTPDPKLFAHLTQMGMDPKMRNSPSTTTGRGDAKLPFMGFDPANDPKALLMAQKPVFQQPEQTKRARTRITDDQLKILRSNFDINNSPTEEMITTMAAQTGLPPKVIKHWFRNTLFKERQRNKDSPYNFNNPPSTMLNLEEYEKTGEPKVIALKPEEQKEYANCENNANNNKKEETANNAEKSKEKPEKEDQNCVKEEEKESQKQLQQQGSPSRSEASPLSHPPPAASTSPTMSIPQDSSPVPVTQSPGGPLSLSNLLSGSIGKGPNFLPHPMVPNFPGVPTSLPAPLPNFLNPLGGMMSPGADQNSRSRSPSSSSQSVTQGKRANRTRFTDYQIKVLQEFFENNAYPKDDDLEYLSKLLSLSPRVIVVWFQNARQKARKIYENQPPIDPNDDGAGRFTRTPGLNYQCKKCLLVFQRYYELIRHQKQHCFKEEDAKRSAQAQKAAAQAAAQFSNQAGAGINMNALTPHSEDSNSSMGQDRSNASPMFNSSGHDSSRRSYDGGSDSDVAPASTPASNHLPPPPPAILEQSFGVNRRIEDEKKMTPSMFDQLASSARDFAPSNLFPNYPPTSPFGMLQQQALQNTSRDRDSDDLDNDSIGSSPSSTTKRKMSEDGEMDDKDESGQPRDKRLRTTILPEQLDYLYQKYQIESNPSRKMLEQIATEVGLRKRVVQVWFQNTRARERKGQFRAHQQVINKRCPFCPALFKVRSALESHLATKHADHYTKGEINIDALPDAEGFEAEDGPPRFPLPPPASLSSPFGSPGSSGDLGASMRKYYEDTMKRYMNDLQNTSTASSNESPSVQQPQQPRKEALDLTSAPALDLTGKDNDNDSAGGSILDKSGGEDRSDSLSENNMFDFDGDEANAISGGVGGIGEDGSPASPGGGSFSTRPLMGGSDGSSGGKRFRTQMSNTQVKVMKSVFQHYKTPTMSECANLGGEIGLQKRVVQVWFQNARAKEKKAKLQLQQATGGQEPEAPPPPTECQFCNYTYTHKYVIQDHLFSKAHLDTIRSAIEEGRFEPESPGQVLSQAASAVHQFSDGSTSPPSLLPPSGRLPGPPTLPLPPPTLSSNEQKSGSSSSSTPPAAVSGPNNEAGGAPQEGKEVEKELMQQIYGMNHGISSYPSGVATANPFLHPAMFSAATSGK